MRGQGPGRRGRAYVLIAAALFVFAAAGRAQTPSTEPWAEILHARVTESGEVMYRTFAREDRERLERVLAELSSRDLAELDRDHAIAFWLNGYHAMVVAAVIHGERPETMGGRARMYHWFQKSLGGYRLTLDDVRSILNRFATEDPRIHLAIHDGTRGGPALAREPYRAAELDAQLATAARRFLADPRKCRVNPASGRIELSKVFEWYRVDFERQASSVANFLRAFAASEELQRVLAAPVVGIDSLPYDWRLAAAERMD